MSEKKRFRSFLTPSGVRWYCPSGSETRISAQHTKNCGAHAGHVWSGRATRAPPPSSATERLAFTPSRQAESAFEQYYVHYSAKLLFSDVKATSLGDFFEDKCTYTYCVNCPSGQNNEAPLICQVIKKKKGRTAQQPVLFPAAKVGSALVKKSSLFSVSQKMQSG